jgi:hypothetical protein
MFCEKEASYVKERLSPVQVHVTGNTWVIFSFLAHFMSLLITLEVLSEITPHHVCESLLQSLALKPLYENVHHTKATLHLIRHFQQCTSV